jgi:hypothetical protein
MNARPARTKACVLHRIANWGHYLCAAGPFGGAFHSPVKQVRDASR